MRAYQPADPRHWIHWPTTARRDELFVRQFDLDAAGDVWLLLDMQQAVQLNPREGAVEDGLSNGGVADDGIKAAGDGWSIVGTEEFAVLLAATLAARTLQQNRAIGLAAYGGQPQLVAPNLGQGQQWKLLEALAVATADGQNDLSRSLRDLGQLARRGSAVIVITPSGQLDWLPELLHLTQRAITPHVVLLDRTSFGGEGNSRAMRDVLRRQGFQVTVVQQGDLGQPLQAFERRGFWEFKVTGTGKVVAVRTPLER